MDGIPFLMRLQIGRGVVRGTTLNICEPQHAHAHAAVLLVASLAPPVRTSCRKKLKVDTFKSRSTGIFQIRTEILLRSILGRSLLERHPESNESLVYKIS